jgi:hypothetical protein
VVRVREVTRPGPHPGRALPAPIGEAYYHHQPGTTEDLTRRPPARHVDPMASM